MNNDRRVHAYTSQWKIVRYERAGKWYVEWVGSGTAPEFVLHEPHQNNPLRVNRQGRVAVSVGMAAWVASKLGAAVYFDLPGGRTFDARIMEQRHWAAVRG